MSLVEQSLCIKLATLAVKKALKDSGVSLGDKCLLQNFSTFPEHPGQNRLFTVTLLDHVSYYETISRRAAICP